ncbi:hypothetical protein [Moorena producens]|uniref:hypothetical protein n=1 Tax=Moorena producens TaxID=1155739 RepID=UPI0011EA664C|nr:hypothetical protein [Moorena producens]
MPAPKDQEQARCLFHKTLKIIPLLSNAPLEPLKAIAPVAKTNIPIQARTLSKTKPTDQLSKDILRSPFAAHSDPMSMSTQRYQE